MERAMKKKKSSGKIDMVGKSGHRSRTDTNTRWHAVTPIFPCIPTTFLYCSNTTWHV